MFARYGLCASANKTKFHADIRYFHSVIITQNRQNRFVDLM